MPVYKPLQLYLSVGYIALGPIINHFTVSEYIEERKICLFPSFEAVLKQLQTKTVARSNERTNIYIRKFFLKATFALLSVIVVGWKSSETSIEGNIYN
jgi:hypothetical protein